MRFRKSINIFKGVKLNFSKSGVSLTVGGKGVSANIGKKGLFLNTSLPGTGLYDRKKIVDFGTDARKASKQPMPKPQAAPVVAQTPSSVLLDLDEAGNIIVYGDDGARVTNPDVLRRLKAREDFQAAGAELLETRAAQANAETDAFVNIAAQSASLAKTDPLDAGAPMGEDEVEARIAEWLGALSLPIDFHVDYEYDAQAGALMADMDLPEIQHLPVQKTAVVAGKLKKKDKTQKELKQEYARCVFGLGIFCASHFFAVTPYMERVVLSAYTQRRDSKTGDLRDEYIYSVIFERECFEDVDFAGVEPEEFLMRFKNRMNRSAAGDLKPVVPFDAQAL